MEGLEPERDLSEGRPGLSKDSSPCLVRPFTAQSRTHANVDKIDMSGHNGRWGPKDLYVTLEREENSPQIMRIEFPVFLLRWDSQICFDSRKTN